MPAIKPPFPIAVGNLDLGNWRFGGAQLDIFYPFNLAQSFTGTGVGNAPVEVINALGGGVGGSGPITVANDAAQVSGRRAWLNSNSTNFIVTAPARWQPALPIAILARVRFNAVNARSAIHANCAVTLGNWRGVFAYIASTGKLVCGFGDGTGTSETTAVRIKTGTTALSANTYYDVAFVIRGATDMSIYLNGVDDGGSYTGSGGALTYGATAIRWGILPGNTPGSFNGGFDYLMQLSPASGASDIDATVIQALQFDPWALVAETNAVPWLSKRRIPRFSAIAASGVNVSLSGVTATGAVGTLTPTIGVALAGVAGTGAVGTLSVTGTATVALTGVAGTGAVGVLTPSGALTLSGVSASGAVGAFSITGDATITLSGVASSGVVGSFSADLSIALAGVVGAGVVGSLDAATVVELAGVTATGAVGAFGHAISVDLHGVAGTGVVQAFVPFIIPPAFDQFSLMRDRDVDCAAVMSDEGVAALGPITLEDDFTLMRSLPVASRGGMRATGMAVLGAMADDLDLFALMRSTPVAAFGLMRGTAVAARGAMP